MVSQRPAHGLLRAASWLALAWAAAGVACSTYTPPDWPPGTPRSEVLKTMGQPTAERTPTAEAPAGAVQRLEYARGPMGHHTYMIDFDAQQRLLGTQQVLTEVRFGQVQPGMTQQAVLNLLGRPSDLRRLPRQRQTVWAYRYVNSFCLWFEVDVSDQGLVASSSYGPDPMCDRKKVE